MSTQADAAFRRRWYPARLLLAHESRKSLAFQVAEGVGFLLPLPLFIGLAFVRARMRYHRAVRAGLNPSRAPMDARPPPPLAATPAAAAALHTSAAAAASAAAPVHDMAAAVAPAALGSEAAGAAVDAAALSPAAEDGAGTSRAAQLR